MSFVSGLTESLSNTKATKEIGIGGFIGFARTSESTKYTNTLPTEVLEDGSNASDDIINNPIVVTIEGSVGDIIVEGKEYPEIIPQEINQLGEVSALLPPSSQQQFQRLTQINDQARDAILQAERVERIGQSVYDFVSGNSNSAKAVQQKFVDYMESIHFSRVPIEISVSYKEYKNMALQDLTISRNNTDGETKFTAVFMQQLYASLLYSTVANAAAPSPAISGKTADQANNGGQNPESNEESVLSAVFR